MDSYFEFSRVFVFQHVSLEDCEYFQHFDLDDELKLTPSRKLTTHEHYQVLNQD